MTELQSSQRSGFTAKNMKTKVAGLALAVGVAVGVMGAPAFAHATDNANEANCHGVWASWVLPTFFPGKNPAQVAEALDISVQDLQNFVTGQCATSGP